MECPRCDRALERYALGGREAVACDRCGYIGVPVEHRGERRDVESWDDALSRFREVSRVETGTVESAEAPAIEFDEDDGADPEPTVVRIESPDEEKDTAAESDGVACDVCGKRFDGRAQLNGHRATHSGREE